MTWHTVKVEVELPDLALTESEIDGVVFVEKAQVVEAVDSWALAVERAHGDSDIVMVLRSLAADIAGKASA